MKVKAILLIAAAVILLSFTVSKKQISAKESQSTQIADTESVGGRMTVDPL